MTIFLMIRYIKNLKHNSIYLEWLAVLEQLFMAS